MALQSRQVEQGGSTAGHALNARYITSTPVRFLQQRLPCAVCNPRALNLHKSLQSD